MKVLQVTNVYFPYIGGISTHVQSISENLKKTYDLTVATTDPLHKLSKESIINGVSVLSFNSWAPFDSYYFSRELRKYLKQNSNNYDIVHAHGYHAFPALYSAQTKNHNRLVITPHYHGHGHTFFRNLLHTPYKIFSKKIFEKADKVICVSQYEKKLLNGSFKIDASKIVVIPNGVNLREFGRRQKVPCNTKKILCVCRLEKYKGVQHLIEVMPMLNDNVSLEIVGTGPYEENLLSLIKKRNIAHRVRIFKNLSRAELINKYLSSDLFALLSLHEAYGISVAEALAAGIPCIVANTSALTEWVDDRNVVGLSYPIDHIQLKNAIEGMFGRVVNSNKIYDWSTVSARISKLYESLI